MPNTTFPDMTDRALARIASFVARTPVSVLLTGRLEAPAAVVLRSRSLYIDPERVGAFDLIVLADLLARRVDVRDGALPDTEIDPDTVAEWIAVARERVLGRFPGARRLSGCYRAELRFDELPDVSWQHVRFDELDLEALGGGQPGGLVEVSGDDLLGLEHDAEALRGKLSDGSIPLQHLACLSEMPYAELPVTFHLTASGAPPLEELERRRARARSMADGILSCYVDNVRGIGDSRQVERRGTGVRLDPTRLFETALPHRPGTPPRIYRVPPRERFTTFRPEQHLVVVGVDVPSFSTRDAMRLNANLVQAMTMTFESLDVDFVVVAFRDRVVDLGEGRRVYLHLPLVLKRADEPLTDAMWARMDTLWFDTPAPADHATFSPLQVRTIAALFDEAAVGRDYRFYKLVYLSSNGLGEEHERPDHAQRAAADLDVTLRDLEGRLDGTWSLECFFDAAVVAAASPGSSVRSTLRT